MLELRPGRSSILSILLFVSLSVCVHGDSSTNSSSSIERDTDHDADAPVGHPDDLIRAELAALMADVDSDEDGELDLLELTRWIRKAHAQSQKRSVDLEWSRLGPIEREENTWTDYEPTRRPYLTWEQYAQKMQRDWDQLSRSDAAHKNRLVERYEKRWKVADEDGDGQLSRVEFTWFLHPEDSRNATIRNVLIRELKEDLDRNNDNVISYNEYLAHMLESHRKELGDRKASSDEEKAFESDHRAHFETQLDVDKDGALSDEELGRWLAFDLDRHQIEAERLMELADQNLDQKLEISEIIAQPDHFYDLLPPEFWDRLIPENEVDTDHEPIARHDEF